MRATFLLALVLLSGCRTECEVETERYQNFAALVAQCESNPSCKIDVADLDRLNHREHWMKSACER